MRALTTALALVVAALGSGCGPSHPPVAELETEPARFDLAWPEFAELELTLRPIAKLPAAGIRPIVFVHLLDEPGSVLRTFDHELPGEWHVGRELSYRVRLYQSALSEPLAAGEYLLSLGVYHPEHGRFALRTGAEEVADREYRVAEVSVPPVSGSAPRARFSEHWLPPEVGVDRQVLVRRHLRGDATGKIQFGPLTGAGTLALSFLIPHDLGAGSRLELLDGLGQPKVRVANDCGAEEAEATGVGRFDVDLDVPSGNSSRTCEVSVQPNFRLTTSQRAESSSVRLDVVAWRPGSRERAPD